MVRLINSIPKSLWRVNDYIAERLGYVLIPVVILMIIFGVSR